MKNYSMNTDERARVDHALELGRLAGPRIAELTTPFQLHDFALRFNVNDSMLPYLAIARHPVCDEGTALYIYWQFHEVLGDDEALEEMQSSEPDWNAGPVLDALEERFDAKDFATSDIFFDPVAFLTMLSPDAPAEFEEIVAAERLRAVGHIRIARSS